MRSRLEPDRPLRQFEGFLEPDVSFGIGIGDKIQGFGVIFIERDNSLHDFQSQVMPADPLKGDALLVEQVDIVWELPDPSFQHRERLVQLVLRQMDDGQVVVNLGPAGSLLDLLFKQAHRLIETVHLHEQKPHVRKRIFVKRRSFRDRGENFESLVPLLLTLQGAAEIVTHRVKLRITFEQLPEQGDGIIPTLLFHVDQADFAAGIHIPGVELNNQVQLP